MPRCTPCLHSRASHAPILTLPTHSHPPQPAAPHPDTALIATHPSTTSPLINSLPSLPSPHGPRTSSSSAATRPPATAATPSSPKQLDLAIVVIDARQHISPSPPTRSPLPAASVPAQPAPAVMLRLHPNAIQPCRLHSGGRASPRMPLRRTTQAYPPTLAPCNPSLRVPSCARCSSGLARTTWSSHTSQPCT